MLDIFVDTGCALPWMMTGFVPKSGQRIMHDLNNTAMGWSLPATIGGSVASPERPNACIIGDGSLMMSMHDLVTLSAINPRARVVLVDGHRPEWSDTLVAHAHTLGAPLVLDAGSWTDSIRALAPRAGHLVASEACARAALGGDDPAGKEPAALRRALLARDDAFVVVTLGPRGLVWSSPSLSGAQPAFCIDSLDTTGAGDAFHGAYALGLARGLEAEERLRLASAAGALACTRPGAWPSLAGAREIADLLALP